MATPLPRHAHLKMLSRAGQQIIELRECRMLFHMSIIPPRNEAREFFQESSLEQALRT